jgi:hypothetical protein
VKLWRRLLLILQKKLSDPLQEFDKTDRIILSSLPEEFKIEKGQNDEKVWKDFLAIIARVRQARRSEERMNSKVVLTLPATRAGRVEGCDERF